MAIEFFLKKAKKIKEDYTRPHDSHKPHDVGHDDSNWLVSYADMMTLLCGFFIMLFALTFMEKPKSAQIKKAVSEHFNDQYDEPNKGLVQVVTQVLQEGGIASNTSLSWDEDGVTIIFDSSIFFDTLSAFLKPQSAPVLDKLIEGIKDRQKKEQVRYRIVIEGHTDGRPVLSGPYPSNWELSSARAARVLRHFAERGVDPRQLLAIGYADTRPRVKNRTPAGEWNEEALQKNRRVAIRILLPEAVALADPEAPVIEPNTTH